MFSRLSAFLLLCLAPTAWAGSVSLSLETIRHPAFEADGVVIRFDAFRRGDADIRVARLKVGEVEYRDVTLRCADFALDANGIDCPRGQIRRGVGGTRRGTVTERAPLPFSFSYRPADGRLELSVADADAVAISPLVKRMRAWKPQGRVDLRLVADRRRAELTLALRGLRFASREGDIAAEGMDIQVAATAERMAAGWRWRATADWPQGELLWAPWYRKAGVRADASGTLTEQELTVEQARLDFAGIGAATAALRWDRGQGEATHWGFVTERLALASAVSEWVQPWLDQFAAPKLKADGHARFAAEWSRGHLRSFYAGLEEANLADGTGHLALRGINARVPWERDGTSEAELGVAGGRLGDLPLGGFSIPVTLQGTQVSLERLSVPMLDGRLYVDEARATLGAQGWRGRYSGGIEGVSMAKLSAALKLPAMGGRLTARIPGAIYADRLLTLDGALTIEVFDGRIVATGLQVLDPLRATQRFVADVQARNLDLGLLTRTFSFGSIQGRFDADLEGLELQGWKPLRFEARVASSPGEYKRTISRGALQDISALGGAAGAAAVSASPAGFFNTFDYSRIGFGCVLRDNVCRFEGLAPAGEGYVLIEGSGIPSVRVIGYNRSIDWDLLVSRVQAVIAGRAKAVIE